LHVVERAIVRRGHGSPLAGTARRDIEVVMNFTLGCSLAYSLSTPVPFLFNLEAAVSVGQSILSERLTLDPDLPVERWTVAESGNRLLRILAGPGAFRLHYEAEVALATQLDDPAAIGEVPAAELPFAAYPYLLPSRYCQSDRLEHFAQKTFGRVPLGYQRANAVCNWIRDHVDYASGSSDESTSALDTATQRIGVCRDFAHLAITLCRALGMPARYVSAYAWRLDPPDFHAVIEVWLQGPAGGGWYVFDPTRMSAPDGIVRIGVGRDAAEVAFSTPFGPFEAEKPAVWIKGPKGAEEAVTTRAVRRGG
jgi:transglutaminase-like putative cysteine protease